MGLSNAKTLNAIGTPFAKEAYRLENGQLMAGPGCTFAKSSEDIGNMRLFSPALDLGVWPVKPEIVQPKGPNGS